MSFDLQPHSTPTPPPGLAAMFLHHEHHSILFSPLSPSVHTTAQERVFAPHKVCTCLTIVDPRCCHHSAPPIVNYCRHHSIGIVAVVITVIVVITIVVVPLG
jgi:hypothetical protein